MSGFALRLCPKAIIHRDVSWARMYKSIKAWKLDPLKPEVLLIQMNYDLPFKEPDIRFEMRLYRKTDPADPNNPDQGFIIKCPAWEAWHFTPGKQAKDEYPHMPPAGYYLGDHEIKTVILPVIENFYQDIVVCKYHMQDLPQLLPLSRKFVVATFNGSDEEKWIVHNMELNKEIDSILNILLE